MEVLAWGGGGGAPGSVHPAGGMSRAPYEAVGPDEMWLFWSSQDAELGL